MITILRPMNLGEILDRTFQIYRSRFVPFVCVAAVPLTARMALSLSRMIVNVFIGVMNWSIALTAGGLLFLALRLTFGNRWYPYSPGYARSVMMLPAYLASILAAPLFPIAITLIYYDQRIRLEGFDVEWMMLQAGYAPGMNAPIPAKTRQEIPSTPVGEAEG